MGMGEVVVVHCAGRQPLGRGLYPERREERRQRKEGDW